MDETKILHIMVLDKFLAPFIDFVDEHFGREGHHYVFVTSERYEYGLTLEHKVEFLHTNDDIFITLHQYMKIAKKIILHGLWSGEIDLLLYLNQNLFKKSYWVMWGGDFYFPETKSRIRHEVIKNINHSIPVTYDDYLYIKSHYNSIAKYHKCINYPRSIKISILPLDNCTNSKKILVGNSATPSNRHLEIFNKLANFKDIDIFVPLSYGDVSYKQTILELGDELFNGNFHPITDMMVYNDYISFLNDMNFAIFNHNRQQGVSNIILLLSMGKTIYLSKENNAYNMLKKLNIIFKDINELNYDLEEISNTDKLNNQKIILENYSEDKAVLEWSKIFG